jgi:nucleoid DNA-binding protein
MHYKDLVERVAAQAGLDVQVVRDVLFALPDILIGLDEGEQVRVPFGVFRMIKRPFRAVRVPSSETLIDVPAEMAVKLRPGVRLRHKVSD